jgi:hypothetical protein
LISTGLGRRLINSFLFNGLIDLPKVQDSPQSAGRFSTATGFKAFGQRAYDKSEQYVLRTSNVTGGAFATINITSVSGALVGKIRTDAQYSIVEDLYFVIDNNGCADFKLTLNQMPEFPLLPFSIISVKIGDTDFTWYSGEISYPQNKGTQRENFVFTGFGSRQVLKNLKAADLTGPAVYTAGTDIGEIMADLAETWIAPFSAIGFNPAKVETETGIFIFEDVELGNSPIEQNLNTFRDMAVLDDRYYEWGVDGENEFYFRQISRVDVVKTVYIPDHLDDFIPKDNLDTVKNVIMIQRQEGLGSGGSGLIVGGLYNSAESVRKYGRRELTYTVPGAFGQQTIDTLGAALISSKSEPEKSAVANGFELIDGDSYLYPGLYRFINPIANYEADVDPLDDASLFTVTNTGDLTVTNDSTILVSGLGSVKLAYTSALNSTAVLAVDIPSKVQRIRFYLRASKTGAFLTMGIGQTTFGENTSKIQVPVPDKFFLVDWDVSALDLRNIGKFGIQIDDALGATVYIDKLSALVVGHEFYKMKRNKAKYILSPKRQAIDCEFGTLPPKMESYVGGLITLSEELKFTNEVR